jgi:hypothetical protein
MIHLATQARPTPASRRPSVSGARTDAAPARRRREGLAWPFFSRPPQRTLPGDTSAPPQARPE